MISSGPAATASADTIALPLSRPSSSRGRTSRSLSPWMLSSLRVATTDPTTLASCMGLSLLLLAFGRGRRRASERHDGVDLVVRTCDDVHGDDVADASGRGLGRVTRRANGSDVAADDDGGVAAARLLVRNELRARGLHRGI